MNTKQTLLFATKNTHKIEEIKKYFSNNYLIRGLKELGINEDIPESGSSFRENALIKAEFLFQRFKELSLAEDSGLVVEALNGQPGIYSARYAINSDLSNNDLLLNNMRNIQDRSAYYIAVIAMKTKTKIHYFEGRCHGKIGFEARGTNGFGYDPIFIPDLYSKTFGELSPRIKQHISHRSKALNKLSEYLSNYPID